MIVLRLARSLSRNRLAVLALWILFYASFTLVSPPLLDDADSVHAEVAREMLLRHDWVTLYANGIRYLEKAPLLYWSMAASMQLFGVGAAAARLPLAITVLALALALETFARRAFDSTRAGLYAALITLSSFGIFIFTRITIPDAAVCLWITLAVLCYWRNTQLAVPSRLLCYGFALCCALNVLTKGLIGIVFPIAIVLFHLLAIDGLRNTLASLRRLYPVTSIAVFLDIAAPWHLLAARANPTQGHPAPITFAHGHWLVPLPTDGNVHGWTWFYFINEHLLRYLNLRVPRDYDTVPLLLFYGLVFVWLMPWSAFLPHALSTIPVRQTIRRCLSFFHSEQSEEPASSRLPHALSTIPVRQTLRRCLSFFHSEQREEPASPRLPHALATISLRQTMRRCLSFFHSEQREEPASPRHQHPLSSPPSTPTPLFAPSEPAVPCSLSPVPSAPTAPSAPSLSPLESTRLLLGIWAAVVLGFFSLSTRQEYYVLPALPALILLLAGWLNEEAAEADTFTAPNPRLRSGQRISLVLFLLGSVASLAAAFLVLTSRTLNPNVDLAVLLKQNPADYALSFGHLLDLNTRALGAFRGPLLLTVLALFPSTLLSWRLRRDFRPHAATLSLAAGAFLFLLAAHWGLRIFSPVLTSRQLAAAIDPQLEPPGSRFPDLIIINGEYEAASTLGFYLHRPEYTETTPGRASAQQTALRLLNGRSSNLWYGSFFPDAPRIFEDDLSLQLLWTGDRRIFLCTDPAHTPKLPGHIYLIAESGGKEILSNQPNPF